MRGALEWESGWFADMRNNRQRSPEWWWAAESPERRTFFRALARLVGSLEDGDILELRYTEDGFKPVLQCVSEATHSRKQSGAQDGGGERLGAGGWWAGLPPEGRAFYMGISRMLDEVVKGGLCLEVRKNGRDLLASLALKLPGGRAEVN